MNHIDIKAYALGEMNEGARAHVASCESCRRELAATQITLAAMGALRDEEMPRRIAFVSDKVFEPKWWQRVFNPTFASACVLAAAIVFHAVANRGPNAEEVQAKIDRAVATEMEARMEVLDQQDKTLRQYVKAALDLRSY